MAKRGRPRLWGDQGYAAMRGLYPEMSDRHIRNLMHQSHACIFRPNPDARSVFGRTPIPLNAGQPFRSCRTAA